MKGVAGELVMFAPVDGEYQFLAVGMADSSYFWPAMPIAEGRLPDKGERHVALIGESVAKALGKRSGDELTIFDQTMKIIGVTGYQAAVNRGVIVLQAAGSAGAVVSRRPGHRLPYRARARHRRDGSRGGQEEDRGARRRSASRRPTSCWRATATSKC